MDNKTNMVSATLLQNMRNHKYEDNNDKTQEKQHWTTKMYKTKHIGLDTSIFGNGSTAQSNGGNEQNQNRNSEFVKCTESTTKGKQIKVVNKTVIVS